MPLRAIASGAPPIDLPVRNLLRHITRQICSGQSIAQLAGFPVLGAANFTELRGYNVGLDRTLRFGTTSSKEAELLEQGLRLGPVGSLIVGEVLHRLAAARPWLISAGQPGFRATLPSRTAGTFKMIDLLTYAQVDPARRGQ